MEPKQQMGKSLPCEREQEAQDEAQGQGEEIRLAKSAKKKKTIRIQCQRTGKRGFQETPGPKDEQKRAPKEKGKRMAERKKRKLKIEKAEHGEFGSWGSCGDLLQKINTYSIVRGPSSSCCWDPLPGFQVPITPNSSLVSPVLGVVAVSCRYYFHVTSGVPFCLSSPPFLFKPPSGLSTSC